MSSSSGNNKNDTISSVNSNNNLNVSHAYGYRDGDDKLILNSGAHSLPVVAPAEPKSE